LKKILIIENDQAILDLMSYILEEEGHQIFTSTNSSVLYEENIEPDLILLDQTLGIEQGSDVCLKLKQDPKTALIPIILISAVNQLDKLASECKADGYIEKPFDIENFIRIVNDHLTSKP
jgi:DNA-binding response OmpR family regulator